MAQTKRAPGDPRQSAERSGLAQKEVLALLTTIPRAFIDEYFRFRSIARAPNAELGSAARFRISLDMVSGWLGSKKSNLMQTLRESYKPNRDYVVLERSSDHSKKQRGRPVERVMLSYDTFRLLSMQSHAPKADEVRRYFLELDDAFERYNDTFLRGFRGEVAAAARDMRRERTKDGPGHAYFISLRSGVKKPGSAKDLLKRLATYNTGRIHDVKFAFSMRVEFRKEVESCVKKLLASKRIRPRRELYQIDSDILVKLMRGCSDLSDHMHAMSASALPTTDDHLFMIFLSDEEVVRAEAAAKAEAREEARRTPTAATPLPRTPPRVPKRTTTSRSRKP